MDVTDKRSLGAIWVQVFFVRISQIVTNYGRSFVKKTPLRLVVIARWYLNGGKINTICKESGNQNGFLRGLVPFPHLYIVVPIVKSSCNYCNCIEPIFYHFIYSLGTLLVSNNWWHGFNQIRGTTKYSCRACFPYVWYILVLILHMLCAYSIRHDDVIKWKHFPRYWPFVREIHRSPVNFPHKGQWRGALMFTLICARMNGWVNNREAGDLRRYRVHYDVIVMFSTLNYGAVTVSLVSRTRFDPRL